jgi:serine/threonine-protein kinase HipA
MGRLIVKWDNEPAGFVYSEKDGKLLFAYSDPWLASGFSPISRSLPATRRFHPPGASTSFFRNLQLEGAALLQAGNGLNSSFYGEPSAFQYFEEFGLDCAGALSIRPENHEDRVPVNAYRDITNDLQALLGIPIHRRPGLIKGLNAKLSIAGFQDKAPVFLDTGRFYLPESNSSSPTTFILKGVSRDVEFLTENEYFCMDLAGRIRLPVPETDLVEINGEFLFLVKRYDRITADGAVARLHQEDLCQALSLHPRFKYEDNRGPGFAKCMNLILDNVSSDKQEAKISFIKAALFNLIIGNRDAHAKNFSFLFKDRTGGISLAPFYDLVSTAIYPEFNGNYAMSYGKKSTIETFDRGAFLRFSADMKADLNLMSRLLTEVATGILDNIDLSFDKTRTINPKATEFLNALRQGVSEAAVRTQKLSKT